MNTWNVALDVNKRATATAPIVLSQGDKRSTQIVAKITDHGSDITTSGLTARFVMRLPDGRHFYRSGETTDGTTNPSCSWNLSTSTATVTLLDEKAASAVGTTHECYFELLSGSTVVHSTGRFTIRVLRSATAGFNPATSYDDELEGIIEELQDIIDGGVPTASTSTPLMDGSASTGSETKYARGDHRHPTDTTRAPLASPALTGTPTAPTATSTTSTTQIATTAFVQSAITNKATTTTPQMDGTATYGSSTYYARADHRHPTDTSRASASDLSTHTGNSTIHVTSSDKSTWNAKASTDTATTSMSGLMSSTDKAKLDGIATGAQANVIEGVRLGTTTLAPSSKVVTIPLDTALSASSGNPVANDAITTALDAVSDVIEDTAAGLQSQIDALRAAVPEWDETAGRYTNESIERWMAAMSDGGRVYGVRVPLYAHSPLTTGEKTGANAGLVLEASTETSVGRNDYDGLMLFMCPRVNGGVDVGGMPYVTAIEGVREDEHPFDPTENTYALTAPYYRRVTEDGQYKLKELSESHHDGFEACAGMFLPDGTTRRPYILRACYMDSAGDVSSKSGTQPAAYLGSATRVTHCATNDFAWSKDNVTNGLTYLTFGDIAWQEDFMEVMLGVKAPRSVAVGCVSYNCQYKVSASESGVRRVILTDAQAANIVVGSTLSIGTRGDNNSDRNQATMHDVAVNCKVASKQPLGNGTTAINLDVPSDLTIADTYYVSTMPWRNGTCDDVRGTFGARTTVALTNGKEPFRFQNVEWELGLYETLSNMYSTAVSANGQNTHTYHIAPNIKACTALDAGTGWSDLACTVTGANNTWSYIKDYTSEQGANVPKAVGGTSTTGYMTAWHSGNGANNRETIVGGNLTNGAAAGVGCVLSNSALSYAYWGIGGRSSAIGQAAPAA